MRLALVHARREARVLGKGGAGRAIRSTGLPVDLPP